MNLNRYVDESLIGKLLVVEGDFVPLWNAFERAYVRKMRWGDEDMLCERCGLGGGCEGDNKRL